MDAICIKSIMICMGPKSVLTAPCPLSTLIYVNYTPCKHSLGGYIGVCLSVSLSEPTSTSFVRFPPNFVEFKIMMCELCSIKDFIVH